MHTLLGILRWLGLVAVSAVLSLGLLSSVPADAVTAVSCKDHFNWREGWFFPDRAHSGQEIPGEGWSVTGVHPVNEAQWHGNLEGGYSQDWHESCGA